MNWRAHCAAVVPCLNEEAHIPAVVAGVRRHLATVLVVDDGSSDRTAAVAEQAGAQVLRHQVPRGKGVALQAGWAWCFDKGFSWALSLDGDGQHSPEDIPAFLDCAEKQRAALVVGNRMSNPEKMPTVRRWVNQWMSECLSRATGQALHDTQCGYRLMDLRAWKAAPTRTAHFEIESEVLLAFAAAGHGIRFVPIQVIYRDERSKINPVRDTLRWFRWWRHARRLMTDHPRRAG